MRTTARRRSASGSEAALYAARLEPGRSVQLPEDPFVHVFVPVGSVDLEGSGPLRTRDAAWITDGGGQRLPAGSAGAEVLVWRMGAGPG